MITEHSVQASDGVKVADVAWASEECIQRNGDATPYQEAPEICIEIVSLSNPPEEMAQKIELYPAKGAHEVRVCGEAGATLATTRTGAG